MQWFENRYLKRKGLGQIDGELTLPSELFDLFLSSPADPLPDFEGPSHLRNGRGKDHPRYGRFIYSLARYFRPELIVEVGTYAGGTSVGWARALVENNKGRLICIDNDTYTEGTYPEVTRRNISATGLSEDRFELRNGDSAQLIPQLASAQPESVDIYLVDGLHTYEGALADIENGLPMLKPGGLLLIHDVERERRMDEATEQHPHPVYEAMMKVASERQLEWCIFRFIRKHLGLIRL